MFDVQTVKNALSAFDVQSPMDLSALPDSVTEYYEHYGFFDTFKMFDGQYHWGTVPVTIAGASASVASHWWRLAAPRGTIVLVHGLFDHVGLFQTIIQHFLAQQYSVLAIDLPGHGLSDGVATDIGNFLDYGEALMQVIDVLPKSVCEQPLFGVGQSTGAAVLMGVVFDAKKRGSKHPFERLVFLGPLIRPRRWRIGRLTLMLFGRFLKTIHRDMGSANTHDSEFHFFLAHHDPLQSKRLAVSWAKALDLWIRYCQCAPKVDTPLLIVQGTADKVVDWKANIPQLKKLFTCQQLNYIEGAKHHLANEAEPWRKVIYTSVTQFLRQKAVCAV